MNKIIGIETSGEDMILKHVLKSIYNDILVQKVENSFYSKIDDIIEKLEKSGFPKLVIAKANSLEADFYQIGDAYICAFINAFLENEEMASLIKEFLNEKPKQIVDYFNALRDYAVREAMMSIDEDESTNIN